MGLIKAAAGAVGGVLADQWKDFFSCESMEADWLVVKGTKTGSDRSSNKSGESNVISSGSGIVVADGQCAMIVEQGKVIEFCAEPGSYTYDNTISPSIFTGDLKEGLKGAAMDAWERFQFGGGVGKDQRIYFFNTKEIIGNKYGTLNPVPFRVVDNNIGLDIDISVRCNGEYSYRVVNPMLFYSNVCGNVESAYSREEIDSQLKSELLTALQPAFAKISAQGVRYSEIPAHTMELADALNEVLSGKWGALRGIQVVSFGVNSITASPEDEKMIKEMQRAGAMRNPTMAAATLVAAQGDAMRTAAGNENGAMMGFMGMGMAAQAVGMNAANLFAMGQQTAQPQQPVQSQPVPQQSASQQPASQQPAPQDQPAPAGSWTCSCGATATGKFCPECGSPKPADTQGWTCSCGAVNKGKFCQECGSPKPAGAPLYRCDKCGWEPEDPANPPKFCPECGDRFDENDMR